METIIELEDENNEQSDLVEDLLAENTHLTNEKNILQNENQDLHEKATLMAQRSERFLKVTKLDVLTGLFNREGLNEAFERLLKARHHKRSGEIVLDAINKDDVIGFVDLDKFKQVNDTFGHPKGDELLEEVANIINSRTRHVDAAGRLGGDEFIVLLQQSGLKKAVEIFEEIKAAVQEIGQLYGGVTASIGVSKIMSSDTFDSAYQKGDTAMYSAKAEGRNRVYILGDLGDELEVTNDHQS
jgi:diguanylate cyclase (GGDEF)-like protein